MGGVLSCSATDLTRDFDYDSYGNVLNRREYGFQQSGSFVVRRRSRSVYKTDAAYLNAYLRSVLIESDVYDALLDTVDSNDVLIAKTTYDIDNIPIAARQ